MDSLQHLDLYTCVLSIGHTARLNLDNNLLFTVESLICKFNCLHAFMRMCCMFQTPIACGYIPDCPQNVWVCYNFIGVVSWVSII